MLFRSKNGLNRLSESLKFLPMKASELFSPVQEVVAEAVEAAGLVAPSVGLAPLSVSVVVP